MTASKPLKPWQVAVHDAGVYDGASPVTENSVFFLEIGPHWYEDNENIACWLFLSRHEKSLQSLV